jgi:hypothetical protein
MPSVAELYAMAKQAVDSACTGRPLSDAIAKVASAADLNRIQIQRVVEMVNHEMNERLRKTASDKTFRFDLASVDGVLNAMPHLTEMPKVAAHDVVSAIRRHVGSEARANVEKIASVSEDSRRVSTLRARDALAKIAGWHETHLRSYLAKQAALHFEIGQAIDDLVYFASDHVMSGRSLVDLKKYACSYDPASGRMWDVVFDDVQEKVARRLLGGKNPNRADDEPAPLARRPDPLPRANELQYEVIDGSHKMLVFLDTLKNKISAEDQLAKHVNLMNTFGPAVTTGVRSLSTMDDVRKHVTEDLEKRASRASNPEYYLADIEKTAGVIMSGIGGIAAEGAKGLGVVAKHTWKPALKYGLPLVAAAGVAKSLGGAVKKNTRDYRPGAYRGVNEGGTIE